MKFFMILFDFMLTLCKGPEAEAGCEDWDGDNSSTI